MQENKRTIRPSWQPILTLNYKSCVDRSFDWACSEPDLLFSYSSSIPTNNSRTMNKSSFALRYIPAHKFYTFAK